MLFLGVAYSILALKATKSHSRQSLKI